MHGCFYCIKFAYNNEYIKPHLTMYPKTTISKILFYNLMKGGKPYLRPIEIYKLGRIADQWYNKHVPKSLLKNKVEILAEFGITQEEFDTIGRASMHWAFPVNLQEGAKLDAFTKVNKKFRKIFAPYVMASPPRGLPYTTSRINNDLKRGTIIAQGPKGKRTYALANPENYSKPKLK